MRGRGRHVVKAMHRTTGVLKQFSTQFRAGAGKSRLAQYHHMTATPGRGCRDDVCKLVVIILRTQVLAKPDNQKHYSHSPRTMPVDQQPDRVVLRHPKVSAGSWATSHSITIKTNRGWNNNRGRLLRSYSTGRLSSPGSQYLHRAINPSNACLFL